MLVVPMFAIGVALAIAAVAFEAATTRLDVGAHRPAGRLINIRPHRMHLDCQGGGPPFILLEAGRDRFSLDWWPVQRRLAERATVCAYDRGGYGWSGRGPGARSPERIADELRELLLRADLDGPFVIAAQDAGAQYALWFAKAQPDRVAGMVWITPYPDAAPPDGETRWQRASRIQDSSWSALSFASRFGAWPWVADRIYSGRLATQEASRQAEQRALLRLPAHFTAARREAVADEAYLDADASGPLPAPPAGMPRMVVVPAGTGARFEAGQEPGDAVERGTAPTDIPEARWRAMHRALSSAFAGSTVVEVDTVTADMALEAPEAIAEAIMTLAGVAAGSDIIEVAPDG